MWRVELQNLKRSKAKAASAALFGAGAVGVQEDWMPGTAPAPRQPWDDGPPAPQPERMLLIAWFDERSDDAVTRVAKPWIGPSVDVVWSEEPEVDWEAESQAAFPPIQVGTLRIAPPWHAQPGDLVIEPGSGFGTGDHPTTRQALLLFQTLEGTGHALDIGCGSGVLALAAARAGWTVHGTDIDDAALENARQNAERNGLSGTFDRTEPHELVPAPLVFANLHAELLVRFADDLARLTGRDLLLAGILASKEDAVRARFDLPLHARLQDGEWVALHYRR